MIPRLLEMFFVMFIGLSLAGYPISWDAIYFVLSFRILLSVIDDVVTGIDRYKAELNKKTISKACIHGYENWDDCPDCCH